MPSPQVIFTMGKESKSTAAPYFNVLNLLVIINLFGVFITKIKMMLIISFGK
jgi:hypothetical protein